MLEEKEESEEEEDEEDLTPEEKGQYFFNYIFKLNIISFFKIFIF